MLPAPANAGVQALLRGGLEWEGLVMCDCDAIFDQVTRRHTQPDVVHAAAAALAGGTDLEINVVPNGCGFNDSGYAYAAAPAAVAAGLIPRAALDAAAGRVLTQRVRLGLFDPPLSVPFNALGAADVLTAQAVAEARALASASIVLLQNERGALPLARAALARRLAVVGPSVDDGLAQLGDYANMLAPAVSLAAAAAAILDGTGVALAVARGCLDNACANATGFADAAAAAAGADAVILQLGLCSDACGAAAQEAESADRSDLSLPGLQAALAAAMRAAAPAGAPIVCVLFGGGAVDVSNVTGPCDAIVWAGYAGMQAGPAIFDVLLGDVAPAARTTLTWYTAAQLARLAPAADYDMYSVNGTGRTYRFNDDGPPQYPFGFGLSFTTWSYGPLSLSPASSAGAPLDACAAVTASARVCNTGARDSDEVAQLYLATPDGALPAPRVRLAGFERVAVRAGACADVSWTVPPAARTAADDAGVLATQAGRVVLSVGGGQPAFYAGAQTATAHFAAAAPLSACGGAMAQQKAFYGGA